MRLKGPPKVFLSANWQNLIMMNYEVDPAILEPYVPKGTVLDTWQGKTYVSLVGFLFDDAKVKGWGVPFHRQFEEINLRFYVKRQRDNEEVRGVSFIKEIVPKPAISTIANWLFNENYVTLKMAHLNQLEEDCGRVEYQLYHDDEWKALWAEIEGKPYLPSDDSLEAFIAEHYWGYAQKSENETIEYEVKHRHWKIWKAKASGVIGSLDRLYPEAFDKIWTEPPANVFVVRGSPVTVSEGRLI